MNEQAKFYLSVEVSRAKQLVLSHFCTKLNVYEQYIEVFIRWYPQAVITEGDIKLVYCDWKWSVEEVPPTINMHISEDEETYADVALAAKVKEFEKHLGPIDLESRGLEL